MSVLSTPCDHLYTFYHIYAIYTVHSKFMFSKSSKKYLTVVYDAVLLKQIYR